MSQVERRKSVAGLNLIKLSILLLVEISHSGFVMSAEHPEAIKLIGMLIINGNGDDDNIN